MTIKQKIHDSIARTLSQEFSINVDQLEIQQTRKEFEGDYTLVVFPLVKLLKNKPEAVAQQIGEALMQDPLFVSYNVIKGFLNLELSASVFQDFVHTWNPDAALPSTGKTYMIEYASPNTNKPLHLGHVRNVLLGHSVAQILKAAGNNIIQTQIINDKGVHICKSMLAWEKFANGETPEQAGVKGDQLVGKYYVDFGKAHEAETQQRIAAGMDPETAKKEAPILEEAQKMLRKWEANDPVVHNLWKKLNDWVYEGWAITFERMGVQFDQQQYESETYLLGKDVVQKGLAQNVFFQKEDGSVWIDLTEEGLDEKLVLRADGTSVYITQDLGTAIQRFEENDIQGLTYVVGNEQDYHFKVLFLILKKLGYKWASHLHHLSYGMVDLPSGKMKTREGTVVDADELMDEMKKTAKEIASEAGKLDALSEEEKEELYEIIGQGALKYFILKVDPKKRILFDPKESIDFNGNTGPFLQYAYVRILSILRKEQPQPLEKLSYELQPIEKELVQILSLYPEMIQKAAADLSPALIANYVYDLVKTFNSFYQNHSILQADSEEQKQVRLHLAKMVADTIANALNLLGIRLPKRM